MTRALLLIASLSLFACGTHYPHDPVVCTSDSQCASGQQCLPEWDRTDAGECLSDHKSCKKPCTSDSECSYCGDFGVCATHVCDQTGARTCGSFCGDGK